MTMDETTTDEMTMDEWYETPPEGSVNWSRAYFAVLCNHVIIIGAMTGQGAIPPKAHWVQRLINLADAAGIPIFLKANLKWHMKRQEWPRNHTP